MTDTRVADLGGRARDARIGARDREGRERAVDPRYNVALEASAGTGKTRVLVDRYVNLLREGVDPANVLAITFTRKAAAEMRSRIVTTLREAAGRGEIPASRWRELRDRLGDIAIGTIDAFCLGLLREFPLEADLDPAFMLADDTEVPRLVDESLDGALRVCRSVARDDEDVALVFAQLGERRLRAGLAALVNRRLVAPAVLSRYLARVPSDLTVDMLTRRGARRLSAVFEAMRGGFDRFAETGPLEPAFSLVVHDLREALAVVDGAAAVPVVVHRAFARARDHFLTQDGAPRERLPYTKASFASDDDWRTHRSLVIGHGAAFAAAHAAHRADVNLLVVRGVWRIFRIAESEYRRTLEAHAVLDFSDVLQRALLLLRQMEEFAQSRYRLESRYHHVLVDEFQDTSRAQWELIALLVAAWGEGAGLAHSGPLAPSIFIVGDRKQSIYSFRDAEVSILREASRHLEALRADGDVRRSISRSFRSVPAILAFVNDLFQDVARSGRPDSFEFTDDDRFPLDAAPETAGGPLGVVSGRTAAACAARTAQEIHRLLAAGVDVRDRATGVPRPVRPDDIAILFRTRDSHREFEEALERRRIPAYVYKGLGFFDADETKDIVALIGYLADPSSDLRTAAWLRSRFVHVSDQGLHTLAPGLADAVAGPVPEAAARLDPSDARALALARDGSYRWRAMADRIPPAALVDLVLDESGYAMELRGPRLQQARENLKKLRSLIRRIQNRGYATLGTIAAHLERMAAGDEANAVIDAEGAVNLMTIHAAKGLEFPVVFVVNLSRGTSGRRDPIRLAAGAFGEDVSVSVGDFLSDLDQDEESREQEETKRLLYVALTRARDRLYLGAVCPDGVLQPAPGSLASILPPSLASCFAEADAGSTSVRWQSTGGTHTLQVCGEPMDTGVAAVLQHAAPPAVPDFAPLAVHGRTRRSARALLQTDPSDAAGAGSDSDRITGTVVHGLMQRFGLMRADESLLREAGHHLVRDNPEAASRDAAAIAARAVAAYQRLCRHPALQHVDAADSVQHEVPFVFSTGGGIAHGTIDCIVRSRHNRVTVLEFKTGRRRPEHEAQLELYRAAAQAVFPGCDVDARLVYADEVASC